MTVKRLTIPDAKQTEGAQPQDKKSTYLKLIAKQQMRLGEESPLSNIKKRQARQGRSSQQQEVPSIRSSTYEYDYSTLQRVTPSYV